MATSTRSPDNSPLRSPATWLVGLAGVVLSALGSWRPSIGNDEGATVSATLRSWAQLWHLVQNIDAVHLGHYALMKPWLDLVGVSEFTVRLPSAIFVGISGILVVLLASRWLPRQAALGAGALAVILPRATHIGMEGRSWALVTVLVVAASICLVDWQRKGRAGLLVAYGVMMGLAIFLEIFVAFVLAAQGLALILLRTRWGQLVRFGVAGIGAVLIGLPVIVLAAGQTGQIATTTLNPVTWARQVLVNQAFAGERLGPAGWANALTSPAAALLALIGWLLIGWLVLRARSSGRANDRELLIHCLTVLLVPAVAVALMSLVIGHNMYNPRYFSFSVSFMAICLAAGLAALGARPRWLVVGLIVVCLVPWYYGQRTINAKTGADWSQVAAVVGAGRQSGDGVFFGAQPAVRRIAIVYPEPFAGMPDLTLDQSAAESGSLSGTNLPLAEVVDAAPDRVWAIWRSTDDALPIDLATFEAAGFHEVERWEGATDTVVCLSRT